MEKGYLSIRCTQAEVEERSDTHTYLRIAEGDKYDRRSNPNGYVNFGTAVNGIHSSIVLEKFHEQVLSTGPNLYEYFPEHGTARLQKAMAEYMTTFLETTQPVQPNNLYFMTSTLSALDVLAHCLADPEDVFLCTTPVYSGIEHGFETRAQVQIWPIPLTSKNEIPFQMTMNDVKQAYKKAIESGKNVRGMMLLNPGNPIGDVIPQNLQEEMLQFCHRHSLHFISDEVYAKSIHDPSVTFHSVLKYPSLPDPERTHLIYGVGKDLGLTTFRVGVLHTYNKALQEKVKKMANFQCSSYPIMEILANILEDKEWCRTLFAKSAQLLKEAYESTARILEEMNLEVHRTPAAIYLWVNFKRYCQPLTFDSEERLFDRLFHEAKLIIYPGSFFRGPEPGWFRIIFTLDKDTVAEGLQRLKDLLSKIDAED